MDGAPPTDTVSTRFLISVVVLWMLPFAHARADVRTGDCAAPLASEFVTLLKLELSQAALAKLTVRLDCVTGTGVVLVEREGIRSERRLSLDTPDAARWLALAAAELSRERDEPPVSAPPPTRPPPAERRARRVRAAVRARLGDTPRTLRSGGEIGAGFTWLRPLWLDGSLRLQTGARDVTGPVEVRASDVSVALVTGYTLGRARWQWLPGAGLTAGATRLSARSTSSALEARDVTRGYGGVLAVSRLRFTFEMRLSLELALEGGYAFPTIEGRTDAGDALFSQTPWSGAVSLGVGFEL